MASFKTGKQSADGLKSNGSASQRNERGGDIKIDVSDTAEETRKQHEQSYQRQTSAFENREGCELIPSENDNFSNNDKTCDNFKENRNDNIESGENSWQNDKVCNKDVHHGKTKSHSFDPRGTRAHSKPNVKSASKNVQNTEGNHAKTDRKSTTEEIEKENKENSTTCKVWPCQLVSSLLSVLSIAAVVYFYYDRKNTVEPVLPESPDQSNFQGHSSALKGNSESERIFGRFRLDQDAFKNSNRTNIRWTSAMGSNSLITAASDSYCLIVPERGTYGVFSVLTFSVNKEDDVRKLAHFMLLEGYQTGEKHFRRKIFAVPVPENRNDPETIPSTLISFAGMEANGRICVYTSKNLKKYLRPSSIDNTINIFKV